jgi:hypothetical protein
MSLTCQANSPQATNRRFKFQKRGEHFIHVHNETLSIPMSVYNLDCPLAIKDMVAALY